MNKGTHFIGQPILGLVKGVIKVHANIHANECVPYVGK